MTQPVRAPTRFEQQPALRPAVSALRLGVEYQPLIDLRSGDVVAWEALARFWDETGDGVPPAIVFARLHDDRELLCDVELRTKELQLRHSPGPKLFVNVDPDAWSEAATERGNRLLELVGDRADVVVEVIENVRMRDAVVSREMIATLRAADVPIALNDVGSGDALLSLDALFDVDVIKLDRSVTRRLDDPRRRDFYRGFIAAARSLGLWTVLEGVEHHGDLDAARALGVDAVQGFLYRPSFRRVSELRAT